MSWGFVAVAGATLVSGAMGSRAARKAGQQQAGASEAGIEEQRRQFDAIQELLAPYVEAGTGAVGGQQALLGLAGPEAQREAIAALETSPQFEALTQQGEEAILQNASATGGLRGGNVQTALAQFRPNVLSQLIEQQYNRLGRLAQLGQASAAGQASAGLQTGSNISNLLTQQGAARAGATLGSAQSISGTIQGLGNLFLTKQLIPAPPTPVTTGYPGGPF